VLDELVVDLELEPWSATISGVTATVTSTPLDALVGLPFRGLRRRLIELLPEDAPRRTLCFSALEDLGGAYLVSGYAGLRAGLIPTNPEVATFAVELQGDICIGWAVDGPVIETIRRTGNHAVPYGPPAPSLDGGDDRLAWHDAPALPPHAVRRRRRTDVSAPTGNDAARHVEHHFRDSYASAAGEEVMHEYLVDATIDDSRLRRFDRPRRAGAPLVRVPRRARYRAATRRRPGRRDRRPGDVRFRRRDHLHPSEQHVANAGRRVLARTVPDMNAGQSGVRVDLTGRRVLVTGASSGIGAATARAIVACGGSVAMLARRKERLDELCTELGERAVGVRADVTDLDGLEAAIDEAAARLEGLDGIVAVAGKSMTGTITTGTPELWRELIELNLIGPLATVRYGARHFPSHGRRDIVLVGSVGAITPVPAVGIYGASKRGLRAACESLRLELAPEGINVGLVMPGMFDTEGLTLDGLVMDGDVPLYDLPYFVPGTGPAEPAPLAGTIAFMMGMPEGIAVNEIVVRPTGQLNP
jgi:NADP-dependent 3-hydroxy acid dehydrogenase YdfG